MKRPAPIGHAAQSPREAQQPPPPNGSGIKARGMLGEEVRHLSQNLGFLR
jgi:hypothetical protein